MPLEKHIHLKSVHEISLEFRLKYIEMRIGYIGTGKEKLLDEIISSLTYRSSAIQWHLNLLERQSRAIKEHLIENELESFDSPKLLLDSQHLLHYIFDDVVFNLASMFDYIGNLVSITYRGPQKSRSKWNGTIKSTRDDRNPIFHSPIKNILISSNKDWVCHLYKYRGDTIHHKIQLGNASSRSLILIQTTFRQRFG